MYESFLAIKRDVLVCTKCGLSERRKNAVFGEGSVHAEIMFIGEGPGADEDETGRPFVGRAGQLLTKMIESIGLSRADVYIANIVKCRPPGNADPTPEYAQACIPYLREQVRFIRPKIIVCLGRISAGWILGSPVAISRVHGAVYDKKGVYVMPTYHPSALLRDEALKREAWHDLKKLRALLDRLHEKEQGDA